MPRSLNCLSTPAAQLAHIIGWHQNGVASCCLQMLDGWQTCTWMDLLLPPNSNAACKDGVQFPLRFLQLVFMQLWRKMKLALAACMADGTQRSAHVRSCSFLHNNSNKQDATPFWWGYHMKIMRGLQAHCPMAVIRKAGMAGTNVSKQGPSEKIMPRITYMHAWAQWASAGNMSHTQAPAHLNWQTVGTEPKAKGMAQIAPVT